MQTNGAAQLKKQEGLHVSRMVEDVIGCKWSMAVLGLVRNGIYRPGAMERALPGLTTKVLNERLRKFVRFGVLARHAFPETPPRVEYQLTSFGTRFVIILDMIEQLQVEQSETRN
jgi:DNA-binding HxlR family transcriptional regulator